MSASHSDTPAEGEILSFMNIEAELIAYTIPQQRGPLRRNPGRMDGTRWNGSSFICSPSIDAQTTYDLVDECDLGESDVDWALEGQEEKLPEAMLAISLFDMARPAKPKGRFIIT